MIAPVSIVVINGLTTKKTTTTTAMINKMKKYFDDIYTVNTIEHETNKIDITPIIIEELKKRI